MVELPGELPQLLQIVESLESVEIEIEVLEVEAVAYIPKRKR